MKKIIIICLLANGLFANDVCSLANDKVNKLLDIMKLDVRNGDMESLERNYYRYKLWIDTATLNCSSVYTESFLEDREVVSRAVKGLLNER